jgi:hypothetical protein
MIVFFVFLLFFLSLCFFGFSSSSYLGSSFTLNSSSRSRRCPETRFKFPSRLFQVFVDEEDFSVADFQLFFVSNNLSEIIFISNSLTWFFFLLSSKKLGFFCLFSQRFLHFVFLIF